MDGRRSTGVALFAATREQQKLQRLANSEMGKASAQIAALSPRERDVLTGRLPTAIPKRIA